MVYEHQDWETVVLRKPKCAAAADGPTETVRKISGAAREYSDLARKLEADTNANPTDAAPEMAALPVLSHEMRKTMINARVAKKMTQEQLAKTVNVLPKIIKDMESGKVLTDRAVLQRVNRILGVVLRIG